MRLSYIIKILETNIPNISLTTQSYNPGNNQNFTQITNCSKIRNTIQEIEKINILVQEINTLKETPLFTSFQEIITLNPPEANIIRNQVDLIKKLATNILSSLKTILPEPKENTISIKLPKTNDFEDLAATSASLQMILSQTLINSKINGQIKILGVESGSIWFNVYLGTTEAVSLIGALAWSAMVVLKKRYESDYIREQVRSLEIKNNMLESIQQAQDDQIKMLIDAEATNIYNSHYNTAEPEQIERLKNSIKELAGLIYNGAEIQASLSMPEDVKNLFPDKEKIPTIESTIKKIAATENSGGK